MKKKKSSAPERGHGRLAGKCRTDVSYRPVKCSRPEAVKAMKVRQDDAAE